MADNGWGFTRDDLKNHNVTLKVAVNAEWDENTPPELRAVFGQMVSVCEHIAEKAVFDQLRFDGLFPADKERHIATGQRTRSEAEEIIADTGWRNV